MTPQWPTMKADAFLREWYSDKARVDPAMLAMGLDLRHSKAPAMVEKRLRELGLRKCAEPGVPRKGASDVV